VDINATLFVQMVVFFLVVTITMKWIWPPVIRAMKERQKQIADGLAAAERGQREHELAEERAREVIKEAKLEAAKILAQAQNQGGELIDEAKQVAARERARIVESGSVEVQQQLNQAKEALREQLAGIALAGAERILEREVDAKVHKDVLDELAAQI
jgi:F-type H+-transporting ATPase subunit b